MVSKYLKKMEPQAVALRKQKQFRWKWFWAAGVMDILACDQHDKWKRFGLWLHVSLDPYCGRLAWLKIWWCNRNPWLIAGYYIEAGHNVGGIPLITQSDRGGENNLVLYNIAGVWKSQISSLKLCGLNYGANSHQALRPNLIMV